MATDCEKVITYAFRAVCLFAYRQSLFPSHRHHQASRYDYTLLFFGLRDIGFCLFFLQPSHPERNRHFLIDIPEFLTPSFLSSVLHGIHQVYTLCLGDSKEEEYDVITTFFVPFSFIPLNFYYYLSLGIG